MGKILNHGSCLESLDSVEEMSIIQMSTQNLNQDYDKCFKNDTWCHESIESSLRIIINYPEERICQLIFEE